MQHEIDGAEGGPARPGGDAQEVPHPHSYLFTHPPYRSSAESAVALIGRHEQ
jgi:hypothetical protein